MWVMHAHQVESEPLCSRPKQVGWSGFLTFNMSHIIKVFKHRPIKPDLLYILKSERIPTTRFRMKSDLLLFLGYLCCVSHAGRRRKGKELMHVLIEMQWQKQLVERFNTLVNTYEVCTYSSCEFRGKVHLVVY